MRSRLYVKTNDIHVVCENVICRVYQNDVRQNGISSKVGTKFLCQDEAQHK